MSVALPETVPLYFGPRDRPLAGRYHPPANNEVLDRPAVVLCAPLGHEILFTHAVYRYMAERFAAAGFPALRFHYDGAGDSFGSDDDADRVARWLESIDYAIEAARVQSGRSCVALFGIRMGATLAAVAAARRGDISDLILWAPCRDGRGFLREMRALHAAHAPVPDAVAHGDTPAASAPYDEAGGFYFTRATIDGLHSISFESLPNPPAPRALVLDRDDIPAGPRLSRALDGLGVVVIPETPPGYATMMQDPQSNRIPVDVIDRIVQYLQNATTPDRAPHINVGDSATVPRLETSDYTEEPFRHNDLSGILTAPARKGAEDRPFVLLMTVGANPHIGPNRMYVPLARSLAFAGFCVLRLDVPGVGDSAEGAEAAGECIYSPAAIESVRAAIGRLHDDFGVESVVLVGLCSGAYNSFRVATNEPRVVGLVLINPQTFEWKKGDSLEIRMSQSFKPTQFYAASLRDQNMYRRLLRGEINVRGIVGVLLKRLGEVAKLRSKAIASAMFERRRAETSVCTDFRHISARGTQTLFLFADIDYGLELTRMHLGTDPSRRRGLENVHLETFADADHTFTPKAARDRLLARILEYITENFI